MVVGAKVCELTDGFLWFVCGLYVRILTSPLNQLKGHPSPESCHPGSDQTTDVPNMIFLHNNIIRIYKIIHIPVVTIILQYFNEVSRGRNTHSCIVR